jgi:6,7-dimethyl-8-ribityllumazine synthase
MNQIETSNPQLRFAFLQARWHSDIVDQGRRGFLAEMERLGVKPDAVDVFDVPGAFEIPLRAKLMARTGQYAAIIACGFVVDGGIYRHDFVASAVIQGLMSVQLETEIPMISVVLTPQHFHEHEEHRRFFTDHFLVKGKEAANACLNAVAGLAALKDRRIAA